MGDYRNHREMGQMSSEAAMGSTERGPGKVPIPTMGTVVNAPFVKVRREPSPTAPSVTNKMSGERVKVLEDAGDYYKINAYGEVSGYILKKYIQL